MRCPSPNFGIHCWNPLPLPPPIAQKVFDVPINQNLCLVSTRSGAGKTKTCLFDVDPVHICPLSRYRRIGQYEEFFSRCVVQGLSKALLLLQQACDRIIPMGFHLNAVTKPNDKHQSGSLVKVTISLKLCSWDHTRTCCTCPPVPCTCT